MHVDIQSIGSFCTGLAALIGVVYGIIKRPNIAILFQKRVTLIAERNYAMAQLRVANEHAANAIAAMQDFKNSVDALRLQIGFSDRRIHDLEKVRPLYDAFILWVPKVLDYVVWIETLARASNLNLKGRAMPPLPEALKEHLDTLTSE